MARKAKIARESIRLSAGDLYRLADLATSEALREHYEALADDRLCDLDTRYPVGAESEADEAIRNGYEAIPLGKAGALPGTREFRRNWLADLDRGMY